MDIPTQIVKYRYHLGIAVIVSVIFSVGVLYVAPRLMTVLSYFWPLFASTAVFIVLTIAFSRLSKLSSESHGEKAGEGIVDYVAGTPQHSDDDE